jgi:hypothetical protein
LRNTVLMIGGALMCVQVLVVVLERQARPAKVDPTFFTELQQSQELARPRFYSGPVHGR